MDIPYKQTAFSLTAWALITLVTAAYLIAARARRSTGRYWSSWRIIFFTAGVALLAVAASPPLVQWAHHDLRGHMLQHLFIGMLAPLGLVLGAPVTLLLLTVSDPTARRIVGLLRSWPLLFLAHPFTALLLNTGGMYLLYLTPLYTATLSNPALHHLMQVHFLAAGYLFSWSVLAGPDRAHDPPGMWLRLGVLLVSIAAHSVLAKLMYGYLWPRNNLLQPEEIRAAAQLMYYGGDLAEVLLSAALFTMWYRRRDSRPNSLRPLLD